jgi:glycosyltransferase involved in cell wall biosynthesis
MKIALVHDQLQEFGGAERVIIELKKIFPKADIYTSFYNFDTLGHHRSEIKKWKIIPSWAQYVPFFKKLYSPLRFLAPKIWESFDFSKYDIVITSSGWYMCKGIKINSKTKNICYLHHPPRYLYNYETAVEWQKYKLVKIYANIINHNLRIWDYLSSQRVDYFIANSIETQKRIKKFYRKNSYVIYPPVDIPKENDISIDSNGKYFITVSRLARAKHIDLLIEAANKTKINLKIVGDGRDEKYLKSIAKKNIEFLKNIDDKKLKHLLKNAKAFLFASVDEEFGIAPVEAMGYGLPVIAFSSGGLKETVKDGYNGFLFSKLNTVSLIEKINKLNSLTKEQYLDMRKKARSESLKYSKNVFKKNILSFLSKIKN